MHDRDLIPSLHPKSARRGEAGVEDGSVLHQPAGAPLVTMLQRTVGNRVTAQLLAEDDPSLVHEVVGRGGGSPLPGAVQARMEQSFGQDFSSVRVHAGDTAARSAKAVQAKAYTVGSDIVLGEGAPSLSSREGEHTLAHELTHVVQQRAGAVDGTPVAGGVSVSNPSDRFERQAEQTADSVTSVQREDMDDIGDDETA
jgi:hypothetical protein